MSKRALVPPLLVCLAGCATPSSDANAEPPKGNETAVEKAFRTGETADSKRRAEAKNDGALHFCNCSRGASPDCKRGSDNAPGTAEQPKLTLNALVAAVSAADPGDRFLLCRGGSWKGTAWFQRHYKDGEPAYVGAYGEGKKPLLRAVHGESGISLMVPGENETYGNIVISDLELQGTADNAGVVTYRTVNDVVLERLDISGFRIAVQIGGGQRARIEGCNLHDNTVIGFLGGVNNLQILGNRFVNNGRDAGMFGHNIYVTGGTDVVVKDNYLEDSSLNEKGECTSISLNAHGGLTRHLLVENNTVVETKPTPTCWGIAVDVASDDAQGHIDAKIIGNTVKGAGGIGIAIAGCEGCEVRGNRVEGNDTFGSSMFLAPRSDFPEPRPTRNVRLVDNEFVAGKGGGVCLEVDPAVFARSDDNACLGGLKWSTRGSLTEWRKEYRQDMKSRLK